jgi:hypothetical protein
MAIGKGPMGTLSAIQKIELESVESGIASDLHRPIKK